MAARDSSDPGTMHRFPTNMFTGATATDGTMQALIRELIITTGTTHSSATYYSGTLIFMKGLWPAVPIQPACLD